MPSAPIEAFTSPYVVLAADNVDTDQIIPARFLKTTERTGLGDVAFHDWRYRPDGTPDPAFPLNHPGAHDAHVLVAGRNFGCGSSREHAVWALLGAGFRAVVSAEFADIFRGNALGNGLLPVQVDAGVVNRLMAAARHGHPHVTVDLASQTLILPDGEVASFPIAPFAKHCLLHGIDELDFLLGVEPDVSAYEAAHPPRVSTVVAGAPA
jgi:3-isopropylmalate/(R)-2-methylmalate dehydratase small subunit